MVLTKWGFLTPQTEVLEVTRGSPNICRKRRPLINLFNRNIQVGTLFDLQPQAVEPILNSLREKELDYNLIDYSLIPDSIAKRLLEDYKNIDLTNHLRRNILAKLGTRTDYEYICGFTAFKDFSPNEIKQLLSNKLPRKDYKEYIEIWRKTLITPDSLYNKGISKKQFLTWLVESSY